MEEQQVNAPQETQTEQPRGDTMLAGGEAKAEEPKQEQTQQQGQQAEAPEKYEYEVPETWSEEYKAQVESLAKAQKLSNEQMKAFADYANKEHEKFVAERQANMDKWTNKLKQDPDFAGDNFNTAVQYAVKGLKHIDTDGELAAVLEQSGYGSHPAVVRAMYHIGKMLDNDGMKNGGNGTNAKDKPLHEILFKNY